MNAHRLALLALVANLLLLLAWYGWLAPARTLPVGFVLALLLAPALPALVLAALRHRKAAFWASLGALVWFSHGVMEAWTEPTVRLLALTEVALSLLIIGGASWDGLRARFAAR